MLLQTPVGVVAVQFPDWLLFVNFSVHLEFTPESSITTTFKFFLQISRLGMQLEKG